MSEDNSNRASSYHSQNSDSQNRDHLRPYPCVTVIKEDKEFVDAFFAIPDGEVTANLHRQSPFLLC